MSIVYLTKKSSFTASHSHKGKLNEKKHKHKFEYEITLCGKPNKEDFLVDFRELKKLLSQQIEKKINNSNLDTLFKNPTTENIAIWIYGQLKPSYKKMLFSVRVYETKDCYITYFGK